MEEYKISDEYDGNTRKLFLLHCDQCSKDVWRPKHQIRENNFCSVECRKIFREKTGKRIDLICSWCAKIFKRFKHHADKVESKIYFCSRKCQQEASIQYRINCANCNIEVIGKGRIYCSAKCQSELEFKKNVENWKSGKIDGMNVAEGLKNFVRKYLIDKCGNKCQECGWCVVNITTGKVPLQIDHIDGDYKNNVESNLRVLCPNCHSLTSTFGSLNIGRGREKRRLKLQGVKI